MHQWWCVSRFCWDLKSLSFYFGRFWIKRKTAWWFQTCFDFHPYWGKDESILTNVFQLGWFNHHLVDFPILCFFSHLIFAESFWNQLLVVNVCSRFIKSEDWKYNEYNGFCHEHGGGCWALHQELLLSATSEPFGASRDRTCRWSYPKTPSHEIDSPR